MKHLIRINFLVLTFAILAACQTQQQTQADTGTLDVSAQEFSKRLQAAPESTLLVDVRTPEEFQEGHLAGALLANLNAPDFEAQVSQFPKTKTVLVYCRSGRRSKAAVPTFKKAGYDQVVNLKGGIIEWQEAGLPVQK